MKCSKILLFMTALLCLTFQACAVLDSPGNLAPGNMTPGNITPGNITPGNITPGNITPGNITPGNITPGNMTPGNMTPGNMTPGNITPSNLAPGNITPGNITPSNLAPGNTTGPHGDWISPNMGQVSTRTNSDPGLAGMLQWLDTPVPNFPWYTTGGSFFYSQAYSYTTFSPFTEYYVTSGLPVMGGIISNPIKFDITQKTPISVYYGSGIGLPFTQYASTVPSKTNDLWIQGATNWTQYVVSPVGTWLQLIAYAPNDGPAGFYEMIQTDTTSSMYKTYQFNQGYNTMNFNADQVGRHMLYFVVDSQPSNVIIVDVFAQTPAGSTQPIVHVIS